MRIELEGSRLGQAFSQLPVSDREQLTRLLEPVSEESGRTLQHAGKNFRHCYFIDSGLVSIIDPSDPDQPAEVGSMGPGGVAGIAGAFGETVSRQTVRCRSAVKAWRVDTEPLSRLLAASDMLRSLLLRCACATLDQAFQLVACAARHSLDQRLARWIFVASHHLEGEPLHVTHDALGALLNVRRASVTTALHHLEGERAIVATRGSLRVRDPLALERCSCGCHRVAIINGSSQPNGSKAQRVYAPPSAAAILGLRPHPPEKGASCPSGCSLGGVARSINDRSHGLRQPHSLR